MTDEQLLDLVQSQTLKYFTDFAEPTTGMARETSSTHPTSPFSPDIITTGGTGFGVMGIVAGVSRGWVAREKAVAQLEKMVAFLDEKAEQHHGVFPHWLNVKTGKSFSMPGSHDDGADLVETSFLMMGLLTARQYFNKPTGQEQQLRQRITKLWERVNFNHHTKGGKDTELYWHWSPTHDWAMNLPIKGWNEALITHVLAAASPTHPVSPQVYEKGWCGGNDFKTARTHHDIELPLGPVGGGPLFLSHYSFLGLNPSGLKDKHADYWQQNVNHTRINHRHCALNPNKHPGLSAECWGMTSSTNHENNGTGYSDHSPTNDRGVVAPTAALSAMPYTPKESMAMLRHLFEKQPREKVWSDLGFIDAFKADGSWYSKDHLAIDQGPIVTMIENHRSGLLWQLFMSCPEVQTGLKKLGFESPHLSAPGWQKRMNEAPSVTADARAK